MSSNNGHRGSSNSNGGDGDDSISSRFGGSESEDEELNVNHGSESEDEGLNDHHADLLESIRDASNDMIIVSDANPFQHQPFFDQLQTFIDVIEGAVNEGVTLREWRECSTLQAFEAATVKARQGRNLNINFDEALRDVKERFSETIYQQWRNAAEHDDDDVDEYTELIALMGIEESNDEMNDDDNEMYRFMREAYDSRVFEINRNVAAVQYGAFVDWLIENGHEELHRQFLRTYVSEFITTPADLSNVNRF